MNVLFVLLGCLAAVYAVPAYFPHGKLVTYHYSVDVKAGIIDPAPHASQFFINSLLSIQHYTSDPNLTNAYYVYLSNTTHQLYNGHLEHYEHAKGVPQELPEVAKVIQKPFIIVFDKNGQLQGIKFMVNENEWSKNIKKAIASMMQLDLVHIFSQDHIESHSFITSENTIHGSCQVAYNIQPTKDQDFMVTKMHEPKNCSHFSYHVFNHIEPEGCHIKEEDGMTTASRRVFEITNQGHEILIKKIIGHSVINYFPWLANAEAHYLLTNQTLIFQNVTPVTGEIVPSEQSVSIDRDITFTKSNKFYDNGDLDVTHGRHIVNLNEIIDKVGKMLDEAAGYLKENHMEKKQPEWKHGQTLNRILNIMSFMNHESLKEVYNGIKDSKDSKGITMKNIFLGMVSNVGTAAACRFTLDVIRQKAVSEWTAVTMLSTLPMHLKFPSKSLLDMEEFLRFGDSVSIEVKKASILCFSTLIHKTYKDKTADEHLTKYLRQFMHHLEAEPTFEMKLVYLMAIKNVGTINILSHLKPIIRGEKILSEKPESIRMLAIWAIKKVVANYPQDAHNLLWPVLANVNLPVAIRIAAYEVLMNQLPNTERLMNMYWFMVYEKDEHLYNYHVETIYGLASAVDPCLMPVREMAKKILRFTRIRNVPGPLSTKFHVDSFDEYFGHGEALKVSLVLDKWTGLPSVGSINHFTSVARKTSRRWGVLWEINGLTEIIKNFNDEKPITNKNIKNILFKMASDMPIVKNIDITTVLTWNDNVVTVLRYDQNSWKTFFQNLKSWKQTFTGNNHQHVLYDEHFEMHVPTDFGVPAILATKVPTLDSFRSNVTYSEDKKNINLDLKSKYQEWKHGEYVMTIYNPIADVWHSIRRTGSRDIVVSNDMTIGYNTELKKLKITFRRLPAMEYSVTGLLTHAKNYVTVMGDKTGVLTACCKSCLHIQNVTGHISNKIYEYDVHSRDTGLRFYAGIYNCEGHGAPLPELLSLLDFKEQVKFIMNIRQKIKNDMISSQCQSCSNLIKIEPSHVYPASSVDLTLKVNFENVLSKPLDYYSEKRINIYGSMVTGSEFLRRWNASVNFAMLPGHTRNEMNIQLTRITPGQENLKICIDGSKDYPQVNRDLLNFENTVKETNTKVTITMGHTKDDKCVRDEMDVTMTVKGEMSDEQKLHNVHDHLHRMCENDKKNSLLMTERKHVPKTWACIREAILQTTLRKYTTDIEIKKVPQLVETCAHIVQDVLLHRFSPYMTYTFNHTRPGNMKILSQYSVWEPHLDVSILQPAHSYKLLQLPFGDPLWNSLMDNVHFSIADLSEYIDDDSKICTLHPKMFFNFDNNSVPFVISEEWTILTGDSTSNTFCVFVKSVGDNRLAMKVVIGEHEMEIVPSGLYTEVKVDGKHVTNHDMGVLVPENAVNTFDIRLTVGYDHLNIDSNSVPLVLYHAENSVTVFLSTSLRGQINGLCGSMNGLNINMVPNEYILLEH